MGKQRNGDGKVNRRGHGEGSIYKTEKNGKEVWRGSVDLGFQDGKRQRKYFFGKTQAEVRKKVTAALRDLDQGMPLARDERQTVEQYLLSWLETIRPPRVRESTWLRAETHLRKHAIPAIGRIRLTQLTRMHLQQLYAKCLANGLSQTTVNHLHGVLHHALKDAMRSDLVPRNVTELADPPRVAKREMHIYTPEQVDTLLDVACRQAQDFGPAAQLKPLIALTVSTGMRAGEVLALRWDDVDLNRSVVKVKSTRTRTAAGYDYGKPKTTAGQRAIPLVARAVEELRAHQRHQKEQKFAAGEAWVDEDRVFPSSTGKATDPSNLRKHWVRLLARTDLPPIHFHDLRHSAASWLIASGVPIPEVSRILGHADPSITMRIYAHAMPDADTRVVAAMERMFGTDRDTARG